MMTGGNGDKTVKWESAFHWNKQSSTQKKAGRSVLRLTGQPPRLRLEGGQQRANVFGGVIDNQNVRHTIDRPALTQHSCTASIS